MSQIPVCDYEGSDYQTSFWEQGGRNYEDRAEAIALKALLPASGRLLLELGAGAGRNTPRYHGYQRIVLLDYSRSQLEQARARLGGSPRYVYVAADIYRLPFVDGLFDAATMIRVLHHMSDAPKALQQVRNVLAPGATFILEFANKQNVKAILRYWLGRQDWSPFTPEPVEFARLNFDFQPRAVRDWLDTAGFRVEMLRTVSHFRLGLLKHILPVGLLAVLDGWFQPTGSLIQLTPSVFTRCRALGETPRAAADAFFKCPDCGQPQPDGTQGALTCTGCGRVWPFQEGIYDFREKA